jgi:predicted Zn-dependent protease with MMP-like domain
MDSENISREQFERWVKEVIDDLPEKYLQHINNLAVFVEDFPNLDQLKKFRLRSKYALFGLYEGYYQSYKINVGTVIPDRITIFRMPILKYNGGIDQIKFQIKSTIIHEIAHHFGSGEVGARKAANKFLTKN